MGISDAQEHLASVVAQMSADGRIDDEDFAVQIGHAYAHTNRVWNARNHEPAEIAEELWDAFSWFPTDIESVG